MALLDPLLGPVRALTYLVLHQSAPHVSCGLAAVDSGLRAMLSRDHTVIVAGGDPLPLIARAARDRGLTLLAAESPDTIDGMAATRRGPFLLQLTACDIDQVLAGADRTLSTQYCDVIVRCLDPAVCIRARLRLEQLHYHCATARARWYDRERSDPLAHDAPRWLLASNLTD